MQNESTKLDGAQCPKIMLDLLIEQNARQLTHYMYQIKFLSERPDFNVEDYVYETSAVFDETRTALIKSLFARYGDISELTDLL